MRYLAFIFLLWLTLLPTINNVGQVLVVLILIAAGACGRRDPAPPDGTGIPGRLNGFWR